MQSIRIDTPVRHCGAGFGQTGTTERSLAEGQHLRWLAGAGAPRRVWLWHPWRVGTGSERSLESIGQPDLIRLAELAAQTERRLFTRNPDSAGRYAGRLLCRALCQGAARHYLDGTTGIKDFDVWSFYAQRNDGPFPYRWRATADFGPSRFDRYPHDPPSFRGRRVDFLGRSLPATLTDDPVTVLRAYLSAPHQDSERAGGQGGRAHRPARSPRRDHLARARQARAVRALRHQRREKCAG